MTIANILRLNGIDVERTVSPTGRIVFQGERGAVAGAPLKPHTFHDGEAPEDGDDGARAGRWWQQDGALEREAAAMSRHFPGFVSAGGDQSLPPAWRGTIDTGRGKFDVIVQHRVDHGLPVVIPIAPRSFTRSDAFRRRRLAPHLYTNGNLCVAAEDDWNPAEDTAATVTAWAAHWYAMYVEWLFTGEWPADGYRDTA